MPQFLASFTRGNPRSGFPQTPSVLARNRGRA